MSILSTTTEVGMGDVTPTLGMRRGLLPPSKLLIGGGVGYWCLNEGVGNVAHDTSSKQNDGTLHGPVWVNGKVDGALSFDGTDDFVEIPADPSLNDITGEATIAAWIKLSETDRDQKIFGTQDGSAGGFKLGLYSNDKVEFEIRDSANHAHLNRDAAGGTVLSTDVWYHAVGVYDNANDRIATYVNGTLDREITTTGVLAPTTGVCRIGASSYTDGYFFRGKIDELYVFYRFLEEREIKKLYESTMRGV